MIQWNEIRPSIDSGPWSTNGEPGINGKDGHDGRDGFDGRDGVNAESLQFVGDWVRLRNYEPMDVVTLNGSSYVAREPNKGKRPSTFKSLWQLLAKSVKGERGDQGVTGPRGRKALSTIIGDVKISETFLKGAALYVTPGGIALADASTQATGAAVVGLSTGAGSYRTSGPLHKTNWNLTPGKIYYLDTVPGGITATPPTAQGSMIARVGIALDANTLGIEISQSILL